MYSLLQRENYYKEILEEIESTGRNEVKGDKKNINYRRNC